MTYQEAAKQALDIQDACNLSGVAFSFARAMQAVCDEASRIGAGTNWKNYNPIVTLFLLKMAELNVCGSTLHHSYAVALRLCQEIANSEST